MGPRHASGMRPETGVMLELAGNPVHSHAAGCCAARSSVPSPTLSCFSCGPAAWRGRRGCAGRSPHEQQNEGQSGALGLVQPWREWAASCASFGRCTYSGTCAIPALGSFPLVLSTACMRPRTQGVSPGRCTACQQGLLPSAEGAQPGRLREWRRPASPLLPCRARPAAAVDQDEGSPKRTARLGGGLKVVCAHGARQQRAMCGHAPQVACATRRKAARRWPLRAPTEAVVAGHVKDGRDWANQERRHDEGRWGGASLASRGPQERRPAPASALPRLPESVLR